MSAAEIGQGALSDEGEAEPAGEGEYLPRIAIGSMQLDMTVDKLFDVGKSISGAQVDDTPKPGPAERAGDSSDIDQI